MKALLTPLLLLTLASLLFAAPQKHYGSRHHGHSSGNSSTNDPNSDACADHLNMWSDDYQSQARAEEEKTLPKQQPLKITASRNGGIHVKQWDRNEIGIKVCKAALADSDAEAQRMVNAISLSIQGNNVTINGPDGLSPNGNWSSVVLVHVPVGAQLDLSAYNGGISFKRVDVNATARTVNGGISLDEASGKLDVEAQNGGVSVTDCNGDIKVDVQNGGVALRLASTWKGAGLEARTHNGGLSVEVPRDFKSALEVSGSRHSPIVCQDDVCSRGQRTWNNDDDRILRIGAGDPVIRTSTINGGIVVKNRGRGDDDTI